MSPSEKFPGFGRLYQVKDPFTDAFRAEVSLGSDAAEDVIRGAAGQFGATAGWAMGGKAPLEVVWTTHAILVLLHLTIVRQLRQAGLTGWSATPCRLTDGFNCPREDYYLLSATGRCGMIDYRKTEIFMKEYPAGVFPCGRGLYFDAATWDGSDVFVPVEGYHAFFVTERAKRVFEHCHAKNIEFTSLTEIEIPAQLLPAR